MRQLKGIQSQSQSQRDAFHKLEIPDLRLNEAGNIVVPSEKAKRKMQQRLKEFVKTPEFEQLQQDSGVEFTATQFIDKIEVVPKTWLQKGSAAVDNFVRQMQQDWPKIAHKLGEFFHDPFGGVAAFGVTTVGIGTPVGLMAKGALAAAVGWPIVALAVAFGIGAWWLQDRYVDKEFY